MKVLAAHLSSLIPPTLGGWGISYSLARVEVWAPYPFFAGRVGYGATCFSMVFGWNIFIIVYIISVYLSFPFPHPLAGKKALGWAFFFIILSLLALSGLYLLQDPVGIYEEEETQGIYHCVIPGYQSH